MENEKNFIKQELKQQKKQANIIEKIIQGKLNKYYQDVCLTKQLFIKDDKKTVEELIREYVVKLGENIKIKDFKKLSL
jgi:elongation factor Ts